MVTFQSVAAHPSKLQAVLTKVTENLSHELANPSSVAPDWSGLDWNVATAVAAMHGVSSLLSRSLRWRGPEGWMHFLNEQRVHVTQRHARIEKLLLQIDQAAREVMLAQLSDWAFIMRTGTTVPYATKRTNDHVKRFTRIYEGMLSGGLEESWLREVAARDNLFPEIDYRLYGS